MDFPLEVENSLGLDLTSPQNADLMSVLESYLEQLDRGQAPDPERLIAQHPEMAAELPAYLQKLDLLHCASTTNARSRGAAAGRARARAGPAWRLHDPARDRPWRHGDRL